MAVTKEGKTHRLNVLISESLHERLSQMAKELNQSKSAFIRRAIMREFERVEEEELERAAAELASLYESDEELTAFTALDAEDFS